MAEQSDQLAAETGAKLQELNETTEELENKKQQLEEINILKEQHEQKMVNES